MNTPMLALLGTLLMVFAAGAAFALRLYNRLQRGAQEVAETACNLLAAMEPAGAAASAAVAQQRVLHNAAVRRYNSVCMSFPGLLIARRAGLARAPYVEPGTRPVCTAADVVMYLRPGGVPQGPATLTALRAMFADGRLADDAMVCAVGRTDWLPIGALLAPKAGQMR